MLFILVIFILLQMSVRIYSCIFSPSFPISPFVSNRTFTVYYILLNGFHINLATASSVIFFFTFTELRVFPERVVVRASPPENSALPSGNLNLDVVRAAYVMK